jgi:hypothetical protein
LLLLIHRLTKFVGRQREMEAMKAAAERAKAGQGQIVAAMADPGVGKSHLRALQRRVRGSQSGSGRGSGIMRSFAVTMPTTLPP